MAVVQRKSSIWHRFVRRDSRDDIVKTIPRSSTPLLSPSQLRKRDATTAQKKERRDQPLTASIHPLATPTKSTRSLTASTTRVLASDMRTSPFPASPFVRTVPWKVFLPPTQVYSLVMGYTPTDMEDKWFIYSEGPDESGKLKVHFHRSWTGMKIATLFVVVDWKGEGAGTIVGLKWNGTDQTVGMEEEEAKYMVGMCCAWVLGVDLEEERRGFV
jgi:hypothetical protein